MYTHTHTHTHTHTNRVYAMKTVVGRDGGSADESGESGEEDGDEEHEEYLCKWKGLQYAESTWERLYMCIYTCICMYVCSTYF